MGSSSVPPPSKRPRFASSSVPLQVPRFWDNIQKSRYDLLQGTKYSYGRQILWDVFAHANFYTEVKNFIENMGWMGLANLSKKCYNPLLVVDAQFCSSYCVYFYFGPWAHLWRVSYLGLEPCLFILVIYSIESLSHFVFRIECYLC